MLGRRSFLPPTSVRASLLALPSLVRLLDALPTNPHLSMRKWTRYDMMTTQQINFRAFTSAIRHSQQPSRSRSLFHSRPHGPFVAAKLQSRSCAARCDRNISKPSQPTTNCCIPTNGSLDKDKEAKEFDGCPHLNSKCLKSASMTPNSRGVLKGPC